MSDSPAPRDTPRDPARDRDLLDAAEGGDADAVRAALDAGARVEARDDNRRTPLLLAALGDHIDAARPLVAAGADPDAQDDRSDSAWLVTGVTGSAEMGRLLMSGDRAPDLTLTNRFGGTSVIPASERGHVGYARWVTQHTDIDVNHVNDLGWTALLEAVILGDGGKDHQEIVALLLAADADPDIADKDGVTPLQHANNRGFTEIAALLDNA
ncbi:ankyrin repeat domain-containing protein [Streptomyces sp. MAR4 CNY-716]